MILIGLIHLACNFCQLGHGQWIIMYPPISELVDTALVFALQICCSFDHHFRLLSGTPMWMDSSECSSSGMLIILLALWSHLSVRSAAVLKGAGQIFHPFPFISAKTAMRHSKFAWLSCPEFRSSLSGVFAAHNMTSSDYRRPAQTLSLRHAAKSAHEGLNASLHIFWSVPFPIKLYVIDKWWRTWNCFVACCITDSVK